MKTLKLTPLMVLLSSAFVAADLGDGTMMGQMWGFSLGWPWMILAVLIWASFWILIIYLVYELLNKLISQYRGDKPLDLAKRRLAKGDISEKEFESIKKKLK
ncbi:MAG: hypothetical protein Q8Q35_01880 [Nanoarchaeota archaeon]|nr:hypothetical protein [Nanoarchaeota archaeon]